MAESTNGEFPTVLGTDAVFKGELTFQKGVRLLGRFEGEINSKGQLLVAEGATLNGNVKADSIRIDGCVKGNLEAEAKIQLTSSAKVEGDVQAARLEVAEGAVLVGRCMVGVNGQAKTGDVTKSALGQVAPPQNKAKGNVQAVGAKR